MVESAWRAERAPEGGRVRAASLRPLIPMKKLRLFPMLLVLAAACAREDGLSSGAREVRGLAARYEAEAEASPSRRAPEMRAAYERHLAGRLTPAALSALGDAALDDAYAAASAAAYYSESPAAAEGQEAVVAELERRGRPSAERTKDLYESLVAARLWEKARALAASRRELPPPPEIRDASKAGAGRRVYEVTKAGKSATLKNVEWGEGPRVVMLTSPFCSRSKAAEAEIKADPVLRKAFAAHATRLDAPKLLAQPAALPEGALVAYDRADWPGLELGVTPVFYFYRDGELKDTVVGWPSSERAKDLRAGLERVGLSP